MGMALSAPPDRPTRPGVSSRLKKFLRQHSHNNGNNNNNGAEAPKNRVRGVVSGLLGLLIRLKPVEPSLAQPSPVSPDVRRSSPRGSQGVADRSTESLIVVPASQEEVDPRVESIATLPLESSTGPNESQGPTTMAVEPDFVDDSDNVGEAVRSPIEEELDWKWILNLSMHFREQSDREKFFVTYAQTPNLRRRLTVSCDYRDAVDGTLEKELALLRYQRDKSAKIYDAIRDSLTEIDFYDTITNLKLQTSNGRLHVHVTEDLHEIIPYPPVVAIAHLRCPKIRECDLEFDSHLSGFVYKVKVGGEVFIKKEIPGPDTVDEFLYEINALYALADSENVIRFGGCVVDDRREKVKGLLISFASRGALIDILYHERGKLPWKMREKWAKQIISGLSEVHEAGYVQGDFTLSNIVIDEKDDAKIIDINRRGCPVGWEPPEVTSMIEGLQRIGLYIGVKSDIFQLGMVLWGLAHERDEPENEKRPLDMRTAPEEVPQYFRDLVEECLSDRPQLRPSAKDLIARFPNPADRGDDRNSTRYIGEVSSYDNRGSPFSAPDGEPTANGYPQAREEARDDGPGDGLGIDRTRPRNETAELPPNGQLSGDSNGTSTPLRRQGASFLRGSLNESLSDASHSSERPGSALVDFYEDAPQVIEVAPSETGGDERPIPNIIESVIGIPPVFPPPNAVFERPTLERYSTANDSFGDDSDWAMFITPSLTNGHAKGPAANANQVGGGVDQTRFLSSPRRISGEA